MSETDETPQAEQDAGRLWLEWYTHGTPIRERFIRIVAAALAKARRESWEEAEHYRIEASNVYLRNEELETQLGEANKEIQRLKAVMESDEIRFDNHISAMKSQLAEARQELNLRTAELEQCELDKRSLRAENADMKSALETSRLCTQERDRECSRLRAALAGAEQRQRCILEIIKPSVGCKRCFKEGSTCEICTHRAWLLAKIESVILAAKPAGGEE